MTAEHVAARLHVTEKRLSDASPAELIEAALAALGWNRGSWTIELVVKDGSIEKAFAKQASGRSALLERRSDDGHAAA